MATLVTLQEIAASKDKPVTFITTALRSWPYLIFAADDLLNGFDKEWTRLKNEYPHQPLRQRLVWYENHDTLEQAQARAEEISRWPHAWQRRLVEQLNPEWIDLMDVYIGFPFRTPISEKWPPAGWPPKDV